MNIQKGATPHNNIKSLLVLLLLISAIPITVSLVLIQTRYFSRASSNPAQFLFVPLRTSMPPDQHIELMLNTGEEKVGFVRTVVAFDPSKIQLSNEITPSTVLTTVNKKTSMVEANTTGTIEMVFSMWPGDATPSGLFNVAKIPFKSVSTTPNDTASVNIQLSDVEIVDLDSNSLTPTSDPFVFTLNPTEVLPSQPSQQHIVNMNINAPATVGNQQEFTANIMVNTNGIPLEGGDFVIQYNPNILELLQVETSVFSQKNNENINNVTGTYRVSLSTNINEEPAVGTALEPLLLQFKALAPGNAAITISQETAVAGAGANGQQLVVIPQQATIMITENTKAQPSVTPTCTPRPICTFANPLCLQHEPPGGWCPSEPTHPVEPSETNTPTVTLTPGANNNPPLCLQPSIPPATGGAPLTVFLHGAGSKGSGPGFNGYRWDFEGDGIWDTEVLRDPPNHLYTVPGEYTPKFQVQGSNNVWSEVCPYGYTVIVTDGPTLTPTPSVRPVIIPNAPVWFNLLPPNVKGFLEHLYLIVFVYKRQTSLSRLLEGIVSPE